MTTAVLRAHLMTLLEKHRGRKNAIPREKVLFDLQAFDPSLTDDHRFRRLYSGDPGRKDDYGALVCTCPEGLFIPATAEEVLEFHTYICRQSGPITAARRRDNIYRLCPQLRPEYGKQQELGI